MRQVQHFLAAHGDSRFVWMNRAQDDHRPNVPHRAGFKQHVKRDERRTPIASDREYYAEFGGTMSADDAESVETEYLIEAAGFRKDVCAGFDHKVVAKALMKRGVLMPRSDGYPYRQEYIPGHGKFMVYACCRPSSRLSCELHRRRPRGRGRAFLCAAYLARASKLL